AAKPSRRLTGVAEASDPTFPEHAVHPVPAPKRLSSRISNWRRSVSGYEGVFAASRPATGCPRALRYGDKISHFRTQITRRTDGSMGARAAPCVVAGVAAGATPCAARKARMASAEMSVAWLTMAGGLTVFGTPAAAGWLAGTGATGAFAATRVFVATATHVRLAIPEKRFCPSMAAAPEKPGFGAGSRPWAVRRACMCVTPAAPACTTGSAIPTRVTLSDVPVPSGTGARLWAP